MTLPSLLGFTVVSVYLPTTDIDTTLISFVVVSGDDEVIAATVELTAAEWNARYLAN
ncbi:hypothetical protein [Microbacterium gorillae]|uniref:hypothetical protein n=1 Tax=Microbacterium gorillae TaxID=1231063 RepID=UPI003D9994CD